MPTPGLPKVRENSEMFFDDPNRMFPHSLLERATFLEAPAPRLALEIDMTQVREGFDKMAVAVRQCAEMGGKLAAALGKVYHPLLDGRHRYHERPFYQMAGRACRYEIIRYEDLFLALRIGKLAAKRRRLHTAENRLSHGKHKSHRRTEKQRAYTAAAAKLTGRIEALERKGAK